MYTVEHVNSTLVWNPIFSRLNRLLRYEKPNPLKWHLGAFERLNRVISYGV